MRRTHGFQAIGGKNGGYPLINGLIRRRRSAFRRAWRCSKAQEISRMKQ
jgi:hypothetical protein